MDLTSQPQTDLCRQRPDPEKKLDNFSNCLTILRNADFKLADNNDIYRTGVIGQFNLTFELAWKALQEEVDEMILLIRDSFSPAFVALEKTLRENLEEAESDWT